MPVPTRPEANRTFEPCPAGMQQAVFADLVDCGYCEQKHNGESKGMQPMVKLVFLSQKVREDGKPFTIWSRRMKWSFHEKSSLYKLLAAWLGAKRVDEIIDQGIDLETLIGTNALINVEHNEYNGNTYANIGTISPIMESMALLGVGDYERMQNRDSWADPVPSAYDEPEKAKRILAKQAGQQELPVPDPVPAYPHEDYGREQPPKAKPVPQATTSVSGIKDAQMETIFELAPSAGGLSKVREMVSKKFGKASLGELDSDEAQNLIYDLKQIKPNVAVANKTRALAEESDADPDPFADEGEPGYIGDDDERARVLAEGKAQPELIAAGSEPNTAHQ